MFDSLHVWSEECLNWDPAQVCPCCMGFLNQMDILDTSPMWSMGRMYCIVNMVFECPCGASWALTNTELLL